MDGDRASAWGYSPGRPFLLLIVYFVITAAQIAAVALRPPLPDTRVAVLWVVAGISFALALSTAIAWSRWADRALPLLVSLGVLQAAVAVVVSAGGQGQLVAGLYLSVLGVYSGYFLSPAAVRAFVMLASVSFAVAWVLNPHLDSAAYAVATIALADGLAVVVSSLVQRLRAETVHDPLTGAFNRRGLEQSATLLHHVDGRRDATTVVIAIDLDGFKQFNDAHGHQAGDALLAGLVADWSRVLRGTDLLARIGGDEFVLILPATSPSEAETLLERLRQANGVPWAAGMVLWGRGEPLPAALRCADEEMYRHKPAHGQRQGR